MLGKAQGKVGGGGPKGRGIPQIRAHCARVRAENRPKFGFRPISLGTLLGVKLDGSGRVLTHIRNKIISLYMCE